MDKIYIFLVPLNLKQKTVARSIKFTSTGLVLFREFIISEFLNQFRRHAKCSAAFSHNQRSRRDSLSLMNGWFLLEERFNFRITDTTWDFIQGSRRSDPANYAQT